MICVLLHLSRFTENNKRGVCKNLKYEFLDICVPRKTAAEDDEAEQDSG